MSRCYSCGAKPATYPLAVKKTFTAHSQCKCPESDALCQRCFDCFEGKYKQCWYFHPTKNKWSKLWGRNWSWLMCDDPNNSFPKFRELSSSDDELLEVYDLPTRDEIRSWLLSPPIPPFTICIADSGQKHIYPFATQANSRELFPVLLEETLIYVRRQKFAILLDAVESLLDLGFSKKEILTKDYQSNRLMKCLTSFPSHEAIISLYRGNSWLDLACFVARKKQIEIE